MRFPRIFFLLLPLLILVTPLSGAQERPGESLPRRPEWLAEWGPELPVELSAVSALLLDAESGVVLYEKEPDRVIPPASLTKLMTVHLALLAAEEGRFSLTSRVPVPEAAWAQNQAPGSSLMFLGPGQEVSGEELLYGLGVTSGNDAAVAVSILLEGSVESFVAEMNREARRLGYRTLTFHDPAGLSPENRSTARELADFAEYLIRRHPGILDFFALPSFTYPRSGSSLSGQRPSSITQLNRNLLLEEYSGADGFKTGYIEASKYNLVATAERDGRRLVAVLLGVPGENHIEGGERRSREARELFDFGYHRFELIEPAAPPLEPLRVYGSPKERVDLSPGPAAAVSLPVGEREFLEGVYTVPDHLWAPLEAGRRVGRIDYTLRGAEILSRPLVTAEEAPEDTLLGRIYDRLVYLTRPFSESF
ncbi:MAG: D-alanyl-D-alanine carboxypeptidase family protein [Alkalispirochaetaceae bacterium]